MDKDESAHVTLVDEVGVELDELRRSGDQLDEAVALQFGLNRTDLRCLGILYRRGRVTAGELAGESGLTPCDDPPCWTGSSAAGMRTGSPTRPTAAASSLCPLSRPARSGPASKARWSSRHAPCSRSARTPS